MLGLLRMELAGTLYHLTSSGLSLIIPHPQQESTGAEET